MEMNMTKGIVFTQRIIYHNEKKKDNLNSRENK